MAAHWSCSARQSMCGPCPSALPEVLWMRKSWEEGQDKFSRLHATAAGRNLACRRDRLGTQKYDHNEFE
jgi:hypothetical protein